MGKYPRAFLAAAMLLSAATLVSCGGKPQQEVNAPAQPTAVPVETAAVSRGAIDREIALIGSIYARSDVSVFAKIPEKVLKLGADEGMAVKKGQTLAVVDSGTVALNVRQAQNALQAAATGLDQARKLSKVRLETQLQQAQSGVESAQTALSQVRDLAQTRVKLQVEQAEAGLAAIHANLRALREGARPQEKQQVEATVRQAKTGLDTAELNYERMKRLYESGAVSRQTFEGVEAQYKVAQSQHDIAQQQLRLIQEGARVENLQAMEAQVQQADAGLRLAKAVSDTRSWEKDIALAENGVRLAQLNLKQVQTLWDAESWKAEITLAETQVENAKVGLELAKKSLADTTITSPINGIVTRRNVDVGDNAAPSPMGGGLFELVEMDVVYAVASASETDLPSLRVGESARVLLRGRTDPVVGKITYISPTVDPGSHTAIVKVLLENRNHSIKPGMYADIRITPETRSDALLIPRSAVVGFRDNAGSVFVVQGGKAIRRDVELGLTSGGQIEVLRGLSEGEQVVVSGQNRLQDGATVTHS